MVKGNQFLHFGRELAKKNPKITVGKVVRLWKMSQDFRAREEHNLINFKKRGNLLDLRI